MAGLIKGDVLILPAQNEVPQKTKVQASSLCGIPFVIDGNISRLHKGKSSVPGPSLR